MADRLGRGGLGLVVLPRDDEPVREGPVLAVADPGRELDDRGLAGRSRSGDGCRSRPSPWARRSRRSWSTCWPRAGSASRPSRWGCGRSLALGLNLREDRPCGRLREYASRIPPFVLSTVWAAMLGPVPRGGRAILASRRPRIAEAEEADPPRPARLRARRGRLQSRHRGGLDTTSAPGSAMPTSRQFAWESRGGQA